MNNYKTSAALKSMAKGQLLGKYGTKIGANILAGFMISICYILSLLLVDRSSIVGTVIYYAVLFIISLFAGILSLSKAYMNLKIVTDQPIFVSDIFFGFKQYQDKAILIQLYLTIINFAVSLPSLVVDLVLPGTKNMAGYLIICFVLVLCLSLMIYTSILFSQVFYLALDYPQYSAKEVLKMSIRLMRGNKGRLFYIIVTFLPLYLLGLLSCCIATLWITPYVEVTKANFYMDIVKNQKNN